MRAPNLPSTAKGAGGDPDRSLPARQRASQAPQRANLTSDVDDSENIPESRTSERVDQSTGEEPPMKTVVLYARASTNEQAQSIPGQLRELREHAEKEGLRIVDEVTDQGEKRHTSERPGIWRLREICETGDVAEV